MSNGIIDLTTTIRKAVNEKVEQIVEEEGRKAAEETRKRVRAMIGGITLSLMQYFDVEQHKDRIVITVDNKIQDNKD